MSLCVWCLEDTTERPIPVGQAEGSLNDPFHRTLLLCKPCGKALLTGDVKTFHHRYRDSRTITRPL